MISITNDSPRWLRELDRLLGLKNLLFISGNIHDQIAFQIKREGDDTLAWTDDLLPHFLQRYFIFRSYGLVGLIDPVDGLRLARPEMEPVFTALREGKAPPPIKASSDTPGQVAEAPRTTPASANATLPDFGAILQGVRACVANTAVPCVFIFDFASRLVSSPENILRDERVMLTRILKASLESRDVYYQGMHFKNCIVLLCDKLNDLPPFLYVNNPRSRSITVDRPDSQERARFLSRTYKAFHEGDKETPNSSLAGHFAVATEGLTYYEIMSLVHLSRRESIPVTQVDTLCQRFKYGVKESEWDKLDSTRLAGAETFLCTRVKGQEHAVARVLDIVKRARVGLAAGQAAGRGRPRGVLFFAGPTGVGKTEMAKSLASLLFGHEDRCLRFDMSEYSAPHSDDRLMGAPPGYVGYQEGGQLTNAIKEKPFSVLLFDEIEKAHSSIFDKFLQILDDGRLTDGKGDTVYFSESIIIFTSNLGAVVKGAEPGADKMVTPSMDMKTMRATVLAAIHDHFNFQLGRPEILNRFGDNFVVFDFIRPPVDKEILELLVSRLLEAVKSKWGASLVVEDMALGAMQGLARERLHHGGRGIRNLVDSALVTPLTRFLFEHLTKAGPEVQLQPGSVVRVKNIVNEGTDALYQYVLDAEVTHA